LGEVTAVHASEYFKIYSVWSKVEITGNENAKKIVFSRKSGQIYVKSRPKWSSTLSTDIVKYISPMEILHSCDTVYYTTVLFGCSYVARLHA